MYTLRQKLNKLATELENSDNELLVLASEEDDNELLQMIAHALLHSAKIMKIAGTYIDNRIEEDIAKQTADVTPESIKEIQILADEFDKSGDEFLQKQASVLDQVLLNLGVMRTDGEAYKAAEDTEVNRLREKRRAEDSEEDYSAYHKEQEEMASEAAAAIKKSIKQFRPLESSLSTRCCPDHPGAQMSRVADETFQCVLDKKIYNWKDGFSTMKGNKIPGGEVSQQTQHLGDRALEQMHFSTRENRLAEHG